MGAGAHERKAHWEDVYRRRAPTEVSWYQASPAKSYALVLATGVDRAAPIIDVGGGRRCSSTLLDAGFSALTVLDISRTALEQVRERLGPGAASVAIVEGDVLAFHPARRFAVWHDRGDGFVLRESSEAMHRTPSGGRQHLLFCRFQAEM
jgi:hypothetical protein